MDETTPPCRPGFELLVIPSVTDIPSLHQDISAGGLLEDPSHVKVATFPALSSSGSFFIRTCSGGTKIKIDVKVKT